MQTYNYFNYFANIELKQHLVRYLVGEVKFSLDICGRGFNFSLDIKPARCMVWKNENEKIYI